MKSEEKVVHTTDGSNLVKHALARATELGPPYHAAEEDPDATPSAAAIVCAFEFFLALFCSVLFVVHTFAAVSMIGQSENQN